MRHGLSACLLVLLSAVLLVSLAAAQADAEAEIEWARQFGTQRYDLAYAAASSGSDVYVAGFTNFALEGQEYHHRYDAFVRKYDAAGNVLWTRQFGSSGRDVALAVVADSEGVTVAGSTDGRFPRADAAGGIDAFIARFGPNGRPLWATQFGTRREDRITAAVGHAGGFWVAGTTGGALGGPRRGSLDGFVAHVGATGEVTWARQFGSALPDETTGLVLRAGTLVAVGTTHGGIGGPNQGGSDGFAVAFDPAGTTVWRRQLGTTGVDRITGIVALANGLYVAGATDGALPGEENAGSEDAFLARLDLDGEPVWYRQFGSASEDEAVAIAAGREGVFVAGSAHGALPDGELLGEWDGFVRGYQRSGTLLWTRQLGTTDYDRVYGLAADPDGLFLAGTTHGVFEGEAYAGDRDVFVLRLALS